MEKKREMTHFQSIVERNKVDLEQKSESLHVSREKEGSELRTEEWVIQHLKRKRGKWAWNKILFQKIRYLPGATESWRWLVHPYWLQLQWDKECHTFLYLCSCTSTQPQIDLMNSNFYLWYGSIWQMRKKWQKESKIFCNPWSFLNCISGYLCKNPNNSPGLPWSSTWHSQKSSERRNCNCIIA